jgi:hypothetical protein
VLMDGQANHPAGPRKDIDQGRHRSALSLIMRSEASIDAVLDFELSAKRTAERNRP